MEEMEKTYPQYDDMNYDDLTSNFDELTNRLNREVKYNSDPLVVTDLNREISYVRRLMNERDIAETTFTEDNDDVLDAFDESFNANWDDIEERLSKLKKFSEDRLTASKKRDFENQVERVQAVTRVVQTKEKIVLDPRNKYVRELIKRSSVRTLNDGTEVLVFRSEQGIDKSGTQIMKRGKTSIPVYSKNSIALREYKELVRKIKNEPEKEAGVDTTDVVEDMFEDIELIDISQQLDDIPALTPEENRELRGVLNPGEGSDPNSRIGPECALQIQVEHLQDTINKTMKLREETDDPEEFIRLEERIIALREARDRTAMQRELEEGRQAQVEDISRFRKLVEWVGENKVGLTGIAVSAAALITALIVKARGVLVGTAKATGKVAKALANLAKKAGPILVPILNAVATALSWGAKGVAWLASHMWVLAVTAALIAYNYLES
ncbi:Hypothetical predicted protein [Paramuricea clavata]|uniref:Uncharacterized protein n=1 Tax=Paramuricea clavata TaxID=317549 RepID=A0A6S7IGB7_PARCT|nr:Hypothetical predicted protein [Paramuricea clavata]CAB4005171.1 Hypothetical predicted protein [Paramuricea clavata]